MINDIFQWCVDILYFFANIFGMTYKEINVWFFCVVEPIAFVALVFYAFHLRRTVLKLKNNL